MKPVDEDDLSPEERAFLLFQPMASEEDTRVYYAALRDRGAPTFDALPAMHQRLYAAMAVISRDQKEIRADIEWVRGNMTP